MYLADIWVFFPLNTMHLVHSRFSENKSGLKLFLNYSQKYKET